MKQESVQQERVFDSPKRSSAPLLKENRGSRAAKPDTNVVIASRWRLIITITIIELAATRR